MLSFFKSACGYLIRSDSFAAQILKQSLFQKLYRLYQIAPSRHDGLLDTVKNKTGRNSNFMVV